MRNKLIALVLILGIITMATIGAAGGQEAKTSEEMELTFFYPVMVGGPLTKLIDQLSLDYQAVNPNVTVKPVYTGNYDDTVVKIQTAIQGKNPPDFFINLATQRFSMASTGVAIPLDDFIAADGAQGKAYIEDFLPGFTTRMPSRKSDWTPTSHQRPGLNWSTTPPS